MKVMLKTADFRYWRSSYESARHAEHAEHAEHASSALPRRMKHVTNQQTNADDAAS